MVTLTAFASFVVIPRTAFRGDSDVHFITATNTHTQDQVSSALLNNKLNCFPSGGEKSPPLLLHLFRYETTVMRLSQSESSKQVTAVALSGPDKSLCSPLRNKCLFTHTRTHTL